MKYRAPTLAGLSLLFSALVLSSCGAPPPEPEEGPLGRAVQAADSCGGYACAGGSLISPLPVIAPFVVPVSCSTPAGSNHPAFDDGAPYAWIDASSGQRAACYHFPTPLVGKRPLVLFFPGTGSNALALYNKTLLRQKSDTTYLSATSPLLKGFIVAAMQPRSLDWVGTLPPTTRFDYIYRHDSAADPAENPDFHAVDGLIDSFVATGLVDPRQIHLTGWSNGAFFAQAYGIARYQSGTPAGNHVASVAVYGGANPYGSTCDPAGGACEMAPPATTLPVQLLHRACDNLVPCDSHSNPSGVAATFLVEDWKPYLSAVQDLIFNAAGFPVASCATSCLWPAGLLNHLAWPDGINDGGGIDWETQMMAFFKAHRRASP